MSVIDLAKALLPSLALGLASAVLVHEAGHYVAARILGARDVTLGVVRGALHVDATFPAERRASRVAFHLAGALANLAVAAGVALADAWLVAGMHAVVAVVTLAPGAHSDGVRALSVLLARAPKG